MVGHDRVPGAKQRQGLVGRTARVGGPANEQEECSLGRDSSGGCRQLMAHSYE